MNTYATVFRVDGPDGHTLYTRRPSAEAKFFVGARRRTLSKCSNWDGSGWASSGRTGGARGRRREVAAVNVQNTGEGLPGIGFFVAGDLFRGALGNDAASPFPAFRT